MSRNEVRPSIPFRPIRTLSIEHGIFWKYQDCPQLLQTSGHAHVRHPYLVWIISDTVCTLWHVLYDQFKAPCQIIWGFAQFCIFLKFSWLRRPIKWPDVSLLAYGVENRPNQTCAYHGQAYLLAEVGFILRMSKNKLCPTEGVWIGQKGLFESSLFFDIRQITLNTYQVV